ncbi:MAG: DUF302 domain-containing protein [Hyphomicrobiaceae bacterium]|nr:DUF302 domain-containing protein [Hyphomicrobiaceae bacterium]
MSSTSGARRLGLRSSACAALGAALLLAAGGQAWAGGEWKSYVKKGSIADTLVDLEQAIVGRGLKIDYTGNVSGMLDRTGPDVGSTRKVYIGAQYFQFCSAQLTRQMVEADPANIGYCPFIVFAYERAARPGEVVAGYRTLGPGSNEESVKAIKAMTEMLDGIVKEAME